MTLLEITEQEAGIVLFPTEAPAQIIICNWASVKGVPRLDPFGIAVMGMNEDLIEVDEKETISDIGAHLEDYLPIDLAYDANGDINNLHGLSGTLHHIEVLGSEESLQVIAPKGWG